MILKRIVLFMASLIFTVDSAYALTGREIMEKYDSHPSAKTAVQSSVLVIIHGEGKGARQTRKEFTGYTKKFGDETRMRMLFTKPTRMEFMVWDKPGEDSLQWIKTSGNKVRKIASTDKDKPWLNSHFYNDDVGEIKIDDYKYELAGDAEVQGLDCYKIKAQKMRKSNGKLVPDTRIYTHQFIYISKKDFLMRRVDFYEKSGFTKYLELSHIEKINGIYTPLKTVMYRADGKGKSLLYMLKDTIKYNIPIPDGKFNIEAK